jgi:hypothetical protein
MVIAMTLMGMVQVPVHQIIDMITMRNRLMPTSGAMGVALLMTVARVPMGAPVGMGRAYRNDVFINMAFVRMMQVSIM